jgi:hypothetical protein
MTYSGKNNGLAFLTLILMVLPSLLSGQTDTLSHQTSEKGSVPELKSSINVLYAGLGAGSNMIYLGSTLSEGKPYFSAGLTYGYRNSLFVSGSAVHLNGIDPFISFYTISGSYIHTFNSWFDISAVIAGYFTPESLHQTLFSDFAFINFTAGFDWKLIYTKLSAGDLIAQGNRGYLQIRNSRYFEISKIFKGNGSISFDPNINMLFGKLVKIVTTTGATKYGNSPPFRHIKKDPNIIIESYSYRFGLMDLEYSIPVSFNYAKFTIEFEPNYVMPVHTNDYYPSPEGFSFNVTVYFKIF